MLLFLPLVSFKSVVARKPSRGLSIFTGKITQQTAAGKWSFQLYGSNIIKTTFHPEGYTNNEQLSNAVIKRPSYTNKITLKEDKQTIEFENAGRILLKDNRYVYELLGAQKNITAEYYSVDGFKGFRFQLDKDEQIFGAGERALPMNRRGYGFNLSNTPSYGYGEGEHNLNFSVPFFISSKGYGIFFDNVSNGYLDIGKKNGDIVEAGFSSGELTYYIINGSNTAEILKNYTELVGRQPLPARWVFGNLMSRFGYRSEEQLMDTVAKMKEDNFPMDAVILDLFWFGDSIKNTMGNLDWVNNKNWPDPERMIRNLKDQGIKTILITEPYLVMGSKYFTESKPYHTVDAANDPYILTNFYFGFGGLLDLFRKDACDWFWKSYTKQIVKGVAGWWGDLGEPETHPADMYHNLEDLGIKRLVSSGEVHNTYGHHWNKMLFEKYKQEYASERLFNLNRSGFAGSQRYSIFPWSGDVGRSWSGFRAQLPVMLGMSISGIPYIHSDAGGFAMGHKDPELYTRWLQFAAFTPVFRPHGSALEELDSHQENIESEPVYYPDPYKSIVRKYIQLRYQLLPYNYTLGYQQTKEGSPLTRPMFYNDNSDANLFEADDQYMWGESILVAPVLQKGAMERRVYLPKGYWYKYFSHAKIKGGQWINDLVDINNMPLYVKAGSFIPSRAGMINTEAYRPDSLLVTYYPSSEDSQYTMYDDDGKTNLSWEKSKYELLHFKASVADKKYTMNISSNGGSFDNKPSTRNITLNIPALTRKPASVSLNGVPIAVEESAINDVKPAVSWNRSSRTLSIEFAFEGVETTIKIA
jgi:oligosaccharide 4-alpha-D-glucosyltransferase